MPSLINLIRRDEQSIYLFFVQNVQVKVKSLLEVTKVDLRLDLKDIFRLVPGGDFAVDENGNPFTLPVNGPSFPMIQPFLQRTSPPTGSSSSLSLVQSSIQSSSAASASVGGRTGTARIKAKKKTKDGDIVVCEKIPGYLGDRVRHHHRITY